MLKLFSALLILFVLLTVRSQAQQPVYEVTTSKYLLGTKIDITAVHGDIDSMKKAMYYAFREIERIQGVMSVQIDTTEASRINQNAGIAPVKVSGELYAIISRAIDYSGKYDGIFDITIGPISELWGFSSDKKITEVPDSNIIRSLIDLVNYKLIVLNPGDSSVFLPEKGMRIDLGGIAKGYAVDRAVMIMRKYGLNNFFINAGGDIFVSGTKTEGQKWSIGIKDPRDQNKLIGEFKLSGLAVGTSGDYERFVIIDGKRYHHIFDVHTGYPVMISQSGTALANTTEEAVVLSKVVFITGAEEYLKTKNETGIEGVIVSEDGKIVYDERIVQMYDFKLIK
ncbi:MAG TPA: FAD:protein FMN transferase [Ignavibacteria bacterium]|nr:FAD:protein FMN transferase [Ignavibacteria bacterium]HMR41402.1 FAD:protein FMN transferase [Ignavibacteria bacterium]